MLVRTILRLVALFSATVGVVHGERRHIGTRYRNHTKNNRTIAGECPPCPVLSSFISSSQSRQPLKVFLLAGQSNMVGHASMEHLKILLNDTKTHDEYKHLWDNTSNSWTERNDIICKFDNHVGKLSAGYGASKNEFGPELGFGWVVGDNTCHCHATVPPILLLKTAWGGKDLAIDFRPPMSGEGNYTNVKPSHYGWEYRQMISDIYDALSNETLPTIVPGYTPEQGYTLEGFVWFQGWNDMIDWQKVNEYSFNLADFIRDLRKELEEPTLPFIIGELGANGLHPTGQGADRMIKFRQAQKYVTLLDEFRNNTLFIPTAQYVVLNGTTYNGNYHYFGRADTYYHIGHAFGNGMLQLMKYNKPRRSVITMETQERITSLVY